MYYATTCGVIISRRSGKEMKGGISNAGYKFFTWREEGKQHNCYTHRLVATTHIPNPLNLPQVNHKNGDKLDNRVENLEWCSRDYNCKHAYQIGLNKPQSGESHGGSKLTEDQVWRIKHCHHGYNNVEVAKEYGVRRETIRDIRLGKSWKHIK